MQAQALEVLRRVERSGEPVPITDHGKPTLSVRRYEPETPTPLERLRGSVTHYEEPFEPVDDDSWDALA